MPYFDGPFRGFLAVMIISSCKMAATARKADYHLRLVQITLRKIVCKSLDKMCNHQQLFDSRDAVVYNNIIYNIYIYIYLLEPLRAANYETLSFKKKLVEQV